MSLASIRQILLRDLQRLEKEIGGYPSDQALWQTVPGIPNSAGTLVVHLVGKDITRFHCVVWPAMLLSAGLPLPTQVFGHGWVLFKGEKMSKSLGTVVDPLDAVEKFGPDPLRLFLTKEIVFGNDGDFSWDRFEEKYNADLANNLGNLLSRVATVVAKKCDGIGPAPRQDSPLAAVATAAVAAAADAWERIAPSEALEATWQIIRETNSLLEDAEPWKSEPGPDTDAVLGDAIEALRIVSILASPALPTATAAIWERIGLDGRPDDCRADVDTAWGLYPGGLPVERRSPHPRRRECTRAVSDRRRRRIDQRNTHPRSARTGTGSPGGHALRLRPDHHRIDR